MARETSPHIHIRASTIGSLQLRFAWDSSINIVLNGLGLLSNNGRISASACRLIVALLYKLKWASGDSPTIRRASWYDIDSDIDDVARVFYERKEGMCGVHLFGNWSCIREKSIRQYVRITTVLPITNVTFLLLATRRFPRTLPAPCPTKIDCFTELRGKVSTKTLTNI